MGKNDFPIWENLQGWPYFYHFFHLVTSCQEDSHVIRKIFDSIIPFLVFLKLSCLPLVISSFQPSMFRTIIGGLLDQVISLKFIESKYCNILIFAFVNVFLGFLIYFYRHRDRMMLFHARSPLNFILQSLSPVLSNYAASNLYITVSQLLLGREKYYLFAVALYSYILLFIFTFIGTLFRSTKPTLKSLSHSFCKHTDYFWLIQIPNIMQQTWTFKDICPYGFYATLGLSLIMCLGIGYWTSIFPFITVRSNIFCIDVFGVCTSFLIIEFILVAKLIPEKVAIILMLAVVLIWITFLGGYVFRFYCWLVLKRTKFDPANLFDNDNCLQLPNVKPHLFMQLIRYLITTKFKEIHVLLIGAIDSERDSELTLECGKYLMIHSIIPHRLRQVFLNFDIKSIKFTSRPTLCEIQYKVDKYINSVNDISECLEVLDGAKQRAKIALYAFVNALCENTDPKQRYINSLNFGLASHNYIEMAEYAIEGNPLSGEIVKNYHDYLIHYGGDFCRSEELVQISDSIHSSLINVSDSDKPNGFSNNKNAISHDEFEQNLSHQKALEIIPNYPIIVYTFCAIFLGMLMLFPIFSIEWYIGKIQYDPQVYFHQANSPIFFKTYFACAMLEGALARFSRYIPDTLGEGLGVITINAMRNYLNSIKYSGDNLPIYDGAGEDVRNYPAKFFELIGTQIQEFNTVYAARDALLDGYNGLVHMFNVFEPLEDRYLKAAQSQDAIMSIYEFLIYCAFSFCVLIVFILIVTILCKKYIDSMIEILATIEVPTLEEFRSNLFLNINQNKTKFEGDDDIDNDGALELDEIETNEVNHFVQQDYTEFIEKSLNAPIMLGTFDPGLPSTLIFYIIILFVLRYTLCPITYYMFKATKESYVKDKIFQQEKMDFIANKILLQLDAVLVDLTCSCDAHPQAVEYNGEYGKELGKSIKKWNDFVDNYNRSETWKNVNFTYDFFLEIFPQFHVYTLDTLLFVDTNIGYGENFQWTGTFILLFIYITIVYRHANYQNCVQKQIRRVALILHSKYTATVSILMNAISMETGDRKAFNFEQISEQIVSQLRDPVIFFNEDMIITGINQQATAELYSTKDDHDGHLLETILPMPDNSTLYKYLFNMRLAYGIRAIRCFDFIVQTKTSKVPYSGCLIPITKDHRMEFAILMRCKSEIIDMQKESRMLKKQVQNQLKRLIPPKVYELLLDDDVPSVFSSDMSCCLAVSLHHVAYRTSDSETYPLDDADITQICLSNFDKLLTKYPMITKLRSFNGCFIFVTSLFTDEPIEVCLKAIIDFFTEFSTIMNKYFEYEILLSGVFTCGGPIFGSLTGITKTLFDVWGAPIIQCFDSLDIVPPGKLLLLEEGYEKLEDKSDFCLFTPHRELDYKVYVTKSPIGMDFNAQ